MKTKTILLVEDNPSDVELTRRALLKNNLPIQLVVAEDGKEALEYLFGEGLFEGRDTSQLPDLVLLDLNLPRIGGLEVLRCLRADARTRRLVVVVLTTSLEERDLVQSYDLHANSYIRKPVDFGQFLHVITSLEMYWLTLNENPPPVRS